MQSDPRELLVALVPRLRRFGLSLTRSPADADDLVQAALERALPRLDQWQPGTRLDSWMFRIMRTVWIDGFRARRPEVAIDDSVMEIPGSDGRTLMAAWLRLQATRHAMDRLPDEQRLVLSLVAIEGLAYREAASVLEVPIGTVMSRLARARARLVELVGDNGT